MLATQTEYLDVFMPTEQSSDIGQVWLFIFLGLVLLMLIYGFWLMSEGHAPKVYLGVFVGLAGLVLVSGVGSVGIAIDAANRADDVRLNMAHNVQEKYGEELDIWTSIPKSEDRDEPQRYNLIFVDKNDPKNSASKAFQIRFDRETSEPFISELDTPTVLTADELEEAAAAKK